MSGFKSKYSAWAIIAIGFLLAGQLLSGAYPVAGDRLSLLAAVAVVVFAFLALRDLQKTSHG